MNIVLIGLGMVAATHVHAIKSAPTLHLSGVLGRNPAKTADFAARHATRAHTAATQTAARLPTPSRTPAAVFIS